MVWRCTLIKADYNADAGYESQLDILTSDNGDDSSDQNWYYVLSNWF